MHLLRSVSKSKPAAASLDQLLALVELLMHACVNDMDRSEEIISNMLETLQLLRKHEVRLCIYVIEHILLWRIWT